jgi:hypothetical protein
MRSAEITSNITDSSRNPHLSKDTLILTEQVTRLQERHDLYLLIGTLVTPIYSPSVLASKLCTTPTPLENFNSSAALQHPHSKTSANKFISRAINGDMEMIPLLWDITAHRLVSDIFPSVCKNIPSVMHGIELASVSHAAEHIKIFLK